MRALLALWMAVGLGLLVPAHPHGHGMLHAPAALTADACADHHSGDNDNPHHDSSRCSICIVAAGLVTPQIVAVAIPPPQVIEHRQAVAPAQVIPQEQPAPISERGPPLA